jgi:Cys-tRNA(Pro)/Cys-tRNA(Cys) deacylase
MSKSKKTNAMRLLEQNNIDYKVITYLTNDGKNDGISVANKINELPEMVFKTLVLIAKSNEIYVCVIPSDEKLSLKKVSKLTNEKSIQLLPVEKLQSKTGYIKGGCSPLAMKNSFITFFDKSIENKKEVILSAGHLGTQIKLLQIDLIKLTNGQVKDIVQ